MHKVFGSIGFVLAVVLVLPGVAFAHVAVSPDAAGTGERVTFTVSVPNEKQVPVTGLKVSIPAGVDDAMPTVHTGWNISTATDSDDNVTEIRWEGGSIPVGQRDDFTFRAQVPAKASTLNWKAYQTYADGTTVSWDQPPTASHNEKESETSGPYSITKVADDLAAGQAKTSSTDAANTARTANWAFAISLIALVLGAVAMTKRRR